MSVRSKMVSLATGCIAASAAVVLVAGPAQAAPTCISDTFGDGCYQPSSNNFKVEDTASDGHSTLLRYGPVGAPGSLSTLWDDNGANNGYVYSGTVPSGAKYRFQICEGDHNTNNIFSCTSFTSITTNAVT